MNVAKLVVNIESPNAFDPGLETEVGFGINLPVLLLAGDNLRNGLVVGVQGGVFARFSLHGVERDLIGTDWLITVPLVLHRGAHRFELKYFHTSSHLGDEYSGRFDLEGINYSRDAVRGLAHLQVASVVGIYGGGGWAYNVHPDDDPRWTGRLMPNPTSVSSPGSNALGLSMFTTSFATFTGSRGAPSRV
ncbi:MAG: DUF1207 domain-containing protein, partial [Gemmatimonadales bacterium]